MLSEQTFAASIAIINGILYDKHKILENSELDTYYLILKDEIDNEKIYLESIKKLIKNWPSSYKRPSPKDILDNYNEFKNQLNEEYENENFIRKALKINNKIFLEEKKK
jgi:hypothetical protein